MEIAILKNANDVYYTVRLNEVLVVSTVEFQWGSIEGVGVVKIDPDRPSENVWITSDITTAQQVADYAQGKVMKHTRTTLITETVEEVNE